MVQTATQKERQQDNLRLGFLQRDDLIVIGWVLGIKVLLFLLVVKSYPILWDKSLSSPRDWFGTWNHWDSVHYQQIAQSGYSATGVTKSFYPLFPWAIRFVAYFINSYLIAAFVVSGIASLFAAVLLRKLVSLDYSANTAMLSVWFFLIFPTAYFLHIGYSESLFLAFALGSILAARVERWWVAGVLGALCWMTRAPGAVLVPALGVEALQQWWAKRRWNWQWLWIALVPLGFVVYLLINWQIAGDPFAFLQARKTLFIQSFAPPWRGIHEALLDFRRNPNQAEMVGAQEVYFAALGLICTIISWIKLRPMYAVWMTGCWLLYTSVTFLQSVPRYTLTMFPIFILFALLGRNRFWAGVLTVCSLLFFALFAIQAARGWWAF